MKTTVSRYHDFSCGHRVAGHEGKCRYLHGHNYRVTFQCEADGGLDEVGRVIDFSVIKSALCQWLEDFWDHRLLLWIEDPWLTQLRHIDPGVVGVPFNPTAERMGEYLLQIVGPQQLEGTGVRLVRCIVEETRKCSAEVSL